MSDCESVMPYPRTEASGVRSSCETAVRKAFYISSTERSLAAAWTSRS